MLGQQQHRSGRFDQLGKRTILLVAGLAMGCDARPPAEPVDPVSQGAQAPGSGRPIEGLQFPKIAPPPTYEERLQQAARRPNSDFFIGANSKIGHATPAKPSSERLPLSLVIVNGVEMGQDYDLNALPDSVVTNVQVLPAREATRKFGPRARGGVVIIKTKGAKE